MRDLASGDIIMASVRPNVNRSNSIKPPIHVGLAAALSREVSDPLAACLLRVIVEELEADLRRDCDLEPELLRAGPRDVRSSSRQPVFEPKAHTRSVRRRTAPPHGPGVCPQRMESRARHRRGRSLLRRLSGATVPGRGQRLRRWPGNGPPSHSRRA
jgi:hypothetical protein